MGVQFHLQFIINLHVLITTYHCISHIFNVILDMLTMRRNNPHKEHFKYGKSFPATEI